MKIQLFIYSRIRHKDYSMIYKPYEGFYSKETHKFFYEQARGVMNTDNYEGDLLTPRWLFSRKNGYVLFGISCLNKLLSDQAYSDETGTDVRGFFGIVYKEEESINYLPLDKSFFEHIYETKITPIWETQRSKFQTYIGSSIDNNFEIKDANKVVARQLDNVVLNCDVEKCKIFNKHIDIQSLFSAAFFQNEDVSIVTGLNEVTHAINNKYKYLNAVVICAEMDEVLQRSIKKIETKADNTLINIDIIEDNNYISNLANNKKTNSREGHKIYGFGDLSLDEVNEVEEEIIPEKRKYNFIDKIAKYKYYLIILTIISILTITLCSKCSDDDIIEDKVEKFLDNK